MQLQAKNPQTEYPDVWPQQKKKTTSDQPLLAQSKRRGWVVQLKRVCVGVLIVVDQIENNCCNNNFIYEAISPRGVRNVLWKHIKTKPPGKKVGGELWLRKRKTCDHLQYSVCVGWYQKIHNFNLWKETLGQQFQPAECDHNESLLGILNKCEILSEGELKKEFCKVYLNIKTTLWHKTKVKVSKNQIPDIQTHLKKRMGKPLLGNKKMKKVLTFLSGLFFVFPISYVAFYCWQQ